MPESKRKLIIFASLFILLIIIFFPVLTPNKMIFGTDFLAGGFPRRLLEYTEWEETGEFWLLWQPFVYSGVPGIEAVTFGDAFYPISILLRIIKTVPQLVQVYLYLIHLLIAGIFTYLFVFDLSKRREAALVAVLAYLFTGSIFSLIYAGHEARLMVNCLLPLVLFLLNRGLDRKGFYWFALAGIAYGAAILSPHVQMAYYLGMMTLAFAIMKIYTQRKKGLTKPIMGYVVFAIIAALLAMPLALPLLKYIPFSPRGGAGRGYAFATSWSMPPEETLNLITPHFSGLLNNYWGRNFFKLHTEYIGIFPLILAFIGIFYAWKRKETKFFTGCAIFALIFSWGGHTPIYRIFYHLMWGVSKFRAPAQIFFTFAFSIAVLAGIGTDQLIKGIKDDKKLKTILYSFTVIAIILLLLALMRSPIINFARSISPQKMQNATKNISNFQTGSFLALIFVAISWALITLLRKKKIPPLAFGIIGAIFVFCDLWMIDTRFLKTIEPPEKHYAKDQIVRYLAQDEDNFRVFPIEYHQGNYLLVHDIENCGGEHGNQLKRYQDFIGAENTVMFRPTNLHNGHMLDITNIKYIIMPNYDLSRLPKSHPDPYVNALIMTLRNISDTTHYQKVFQSYRHSIYKNPDVVPRAAIYYDYGILSENIIIPRIMSPDFDPQQEIILEDDLNIKKTEKPYTPAKIIYYHPNRIEISYDIDHNGILYLSDNYYPMWHAAVDGEETKIYRANYTFRAIKAPKGSHKVKFWFHNPYIEFGKILYIIGIILTIGIVIVARRFRL